MSSASSRYLTQLRSLERQFPGQAVLGSKEAARAIGVERHHLKTMRERGEITMIWRANRWMVRLPELARVLTATDEEPVLLREVG